jgi:hypothetical protein
VHLTQSDLDRYLARALDRDDRARVDLHVDRAGDARSLSRARPSSPNAGSDRAFSAG